MIFYWSHIFTWYKFAGQSSPKSEFWNAAKSETSSHELALPVSHICMHLNASQWNVVWPHLYPVSFFLLKIYESISSLGLKKQSWQMFHQFYKTRHLKQKCALWTCMNILHSVIKCYLRHLDKYRNLRGWHLMNIMKRKECVANFFKQTETIWDASTGGTLLFLTDKLWCIICHVRTFQVTANTSKVISLPDTVQEGGKALRTELGAVGQGVLECIWHPLKQSMPVGPICWAVRGN